MSSRNQSASGMLEIQRHDSNIGQACAQHRPRCSTIAGIERAHIRADIVGVGLIRIDGNAGDWNVRQVAADVGPSIAASGGLENVSDGIGKAGKTAVGHVSGGRSRSVNLDVGDGSCGDGQTGPCRTCARKGVGGERNHRVARTGVDRIGIAGRHGDDGERTSIGQIRRDCSPGSGRVGRLVQLICSHINVGRT